MPYWIDKDYYDKEFKGTPIEDGDTFNILLDRSQDTMNFITAYAFIGKVGDAILMKALAYQMEHIMLKGGLEALNGNAPSEISSETIGRTSVSYKANNRTKRYIGGVPVSSMAYDLLLVHGYLYPGCRCAI